jgi:hypothetical protein
VCLQAIWRQVQALGLQRLYCTDDTIKLQIRQLMALPFARLPLIQPTFQALLANSDQRLAPLFAYFQNAWLQPGLTRIWNMYGVDIRTDNNLEGWHSRFNRGIGKFHPNIWEFLEYVLLEHNSTDVQIQQLRAGAVPNPPDAKYVRIRKNLARLRDRYNMGRLNTEQYITAVSHNLKHY